MPQAMKASLYSTVKSLYTQLQPLDFLLGALVVVRDTSIIHLPIIPSDLAMAGIILTGATRKPTRSLGSVEAVIASYIPVAFYLYIVSADLGNPALIRLARISAMVLCAVTISAGQIHIKSLLMGIFTIITLNIPLFYLGIAPSSYGSALTGYLGDKNLAGATMACYFIILLHLFPRRTHLFLAFVCLVPIYLTNSRTSISAFICGLLWVTFRKSLTNPITKVATLFFGYELLNYITQSFAHIGDFESHAGSDQLRARIDSATEAKNLLCPWHGTGLTTAKVEIGGKSWFFHNSYRGLFQEGGWPFLIVFLIFIVVFCLALFAQKPHGAIGKYTEGATVSLLVCAWRLGEVFLASPMCVLYGLALYAITTPIQEKSYPTTKHRNFDAR